MTYSAFNEVRRSTCIFKNSHVECNMKFQLQLPSKRAHLRCFHASATSDWLRLGPMKIQLNSHNPYHVTIKELMYNNECNQIRGPLTKLLKNHYSKSPDVPGRSHIKWSDVRVMKK